MNDETPIAYGAVTKGTPVVSRSGNEIGTVEHVLEVPDLDLFDGIAVATSHGLKFVDRDQIAGMTKSAVTCVLSDEEASALPAPSGSPIYSVDALDDIGGSLHDRVGRLFGRAHWRDDT